MPAPFRLSVPSVTCFSARTTASLAPLPLVTALRNLKPETKFIMLVQQLAGILDDLRKAARVETRPADERAVDVGLAHERRGIFRLHAAAILDADFVGGRLV